MKIVSEGQDILTERLDKRTIVEDWLALAGRMRALKPPMADGVIS